MPIRMTMTHNPSAQALIDLAVHPRRGYWIAVRRKITRHSSTGCRRVRERLRDAQRVHIDHRGNPARVGAVGRILRAVVSAELLNLDRRRRDQRRIARYSSEEVNVYRYVDRRRL